MIELTISNELTVNVYEYWLRALVYFDFEVGNKNNMDGASK